MHAVLATFSSTRRRAVAGEIRGEIGRQNLQSDVAFQLGIGGTIDGPHAAFTDLLDKAILKQALSRLQGHEHLP